MFRRHPVLTFLLISCGYSWAIWITMFAIHDDHVGSYKAAAMFGPAIGFLVVRKWVTREGFGDAGFQLRGKKYYLLAWLIPPVFFALGMVITELLGGATWELNTDPEITESGIYSPPADWPVATAIATKLAVNGTVGLMIVMIFTLGEDLGWFGYLVPRLVDRFGQVRGALLFGLAWALWHLPIYIRGHNNPDETFFGLFVAVAWTVSAGVLMTWLRLRARSLWAPAIAHASGNSIGMFVVLFVTNISQGTFFLMSTLIFAAFAVVAAWSMHRNPPMEDASRSAAERTASSPH